MAIKRSLLHTLNESFFRSRNHKVSFLQIGANDGINADFLRDRVLRHDWYGVLVEPHPVYFKSLIENYSAARRLYFENVAISDVEGENELFYVREVSPDKGWAMGIASFDRSHLVRHGIPEVQIDSSVVRSVRLEQIVEKYFLYDVDLLVVDVEGHEVEVFKSVDFSRFQPKLIVFEHHHLKDDQLSHILELVGNNYDYCRAEYDSFLLRSRNDKQ